MLVFPILKLRSVSEVFFGCYQADIAPYIGVALRIQSQFSLGGRGEVYIKVQNSYGSWWKLQAF